MERRVVSGGSLIDGRCLLIDLYHGADYHGANGS